MKQWRKSLEGRVGGPLANLPGPSLKRLGQVYQIGRISRFHMPMSHISFIDALIIFFLTLGLLKAIAPFTGSSG